MLDPGANLIFDQHIDEIREIAQKFGGPFYLYSRQKIADQVQSIRSQLPAELELFYSLKANSHSQILKVVRENGLKADVASLGELQAALQAGFHGSEIEFTGPGKTPHELAAAIQSGVTLVIESTQELEAIEKIASETGRKVSAHVRLHPKKKINHAGRELISEFSQFGLDEAEFSLFASVLSKCRFASVAGVHTHVQSQILNIDFALRNYREAAETAVRFALAIQRPEALNTVNLGGGIGIPYSTQETPVPVAELGSRVRELIADLRERPEFRGTVFRFEFGRLFVGEAGAFVTKVLYTKLSSGKKVAVTDGGFTQSQIACGVGQTVRRNLPVRALTSKPSNSPASHENVTIVGPSCYGLDVLAHDVSLSPLNPGDLIVIENVGAYGLSFSPTGFLLQRKAGEFFV